MHYLKTSYREHLRHLGNKMVNVDCYRCSYTMGDTKIYIFLKSVNSTKCLITISAEQDSDEKMNKNDVTSRKRRAACLCVCQPHIL